MIAPALQPLTNYHQFIIHKDKLPFDPESGLPINAQDRANWKSYEGAAAMARQYRLDVGFVLTPETKLFCLDIDKCKDSRGELSQDAKDLCTLFPGAAIEHSRSGNGLHIWGTYSGDMPAHACKNVGLGIELYTERRYIALGESAEGDAGTDCTLNLQCAIELYFKPPVTVATGWTDSPCEEWRGPDDDDELIRRAMGRKSAESAFGGKASFADLWNCNEEALCRAWPATERRDGLPYDASSADAALAQHLAFWTGKDCERIQRLMSRSKLTRDKWQREDYLPRTILGAVSQQFEVYQERATTLNLQGIDAALLQAGTQDSVAMIFARQNEGKLVYNHTRGIWLEWDGTRWKPEGTDKALCFARELARFVNWEGKSSLGSATFCKGVEQLARTDRDLSVVGTDFDLDNYLLNTPAGTYDLRTNTLRQHSPKDRLTLSTAIGPTGEAGETFKRFLNEITLGDQELAEFLQVSLGACLSGAVESHWMLFWIGQGRNGKNTLGELVQEALGDYARKVPASVLMKRKHEGHPTEIANLQGVRLALSSEINKGDHWDEARINEVTGDATLSARYMQGDFFTFRRTHKHLIYGNHRPQLRAIASGIKSRIKLVPFKADFSGREDADLPAKLRRDLGYVMAWLIQGHNKWLSAGKRLPKCRAVDAETDDYFSSQSTVEMWLTECVELIGYDNRPASQCPKSSELYNSYRNWKTARGEHPDSQTVWAEVMGAKFEKLKSDGIRYRGLSLSIPFALT